MMGGDTVGDMGLMIGDALDALVEAHPKHFDKRAAQFRVEPPTFSQESERLRFAFEVSGDRGSAADRDGNSRTGQKIEIEIRPAESDDGVALEALQLCDCPPFDDFYACPHTLAAAWWLQEQVNRRGAGGILEFFGELTVNSLAAGRQWVDGVLAIAGTGKKSRRRKPIVEPDERLQWRIALSDSRYFGPFTIRGFSQRVKKNGRGWTKGREIQTFDLLRMDYAGRARDGQIAMVAVETNQSPDSESFNTFRALQLLVGHPHVAWDDEDADPIDVVRGRLSLRIDVDGDESAKQSDSIEDQGPLTSDKSIVYRAMLCVDGVPIDSGQIELVQGKCSPAEPVVVAVDHARGKWTLCHLDNMDAVRLFDRFRADDSEIVLMDAETAGRFAVNSAAVDALIPVDLPPRLSGPIVDVSAELVFELRPRMPAGLSLSIRMHDDRFRDPIVPGSKPETVLCLTEEGPVRLKRDVSDELVRAKAVIERFSLDDLNHAGRHTYTVDDDEAALELLGGLYGAGDEAPRIIWPEGESLKVRGEISPSSLKVQIDERRDWFEMSGTVTIDGQTLPLSELLAAVADRRSLVRVGEREFAQISEAFRDRLRALGDTVIDDGGGLRISDATLPAVAELVGTDVPIEATARWHESIAKLESLKNWNPDVPENLDAQLRDYQTDGYRWLARLSKWGIGGVLADDMGLGKTVQTLGVLLERGDGGPALVIAPTSVGENWVRETARFAPSLSATTYRDADREKLIADAGPGDIVVVSYQLVRRDAEAFASRRWHTLVLDEAQFIKNAQTKTSSAIRSIDADWRIGLSGTPLENHLGELWSLFRTITPGLLGSWDRFRSRFADPIERGKDPQRRESLSRLMRPFILRRTKDKVLTELPPRTEINLRAELSPSERRLYEETRVAALAELSGGSAGESNGSASNGSGGNGSGGNHSAGGGKSGENVGTRRIRTLAWLTKLRQLACHPRLVEAGWKDSSAKLDLLMSFVDELRDGDHRALLFSQFVKHLQLIREALDRRGIAYQYLDGGTPAAVRQERVDAFQRGEGELFLISLKAGGTGLNLTAADYVVHLDPWWNPAVEDQATDRAHRIGQQKPVTVYRLVAANTIEEKILKLHADKRELVSGVLDGTDAAAKLNTDDLIDLIRQST